MIVEYVDANHSLMTVYHRIASGSKGVLTRAKGGWRLWIHHVTMDIGFFICRYKF